MSEHEQAIEALWGALQKQGWRRLPASAPADAVFLAKDTMETLWKEHRKLLARFEDCADALLLARGIHAVDQ